MVFGFVQLIHNMSVCVGMMSSAVLAVFAAASVVTVVSGEVFTSLADMEQLASTEARLIDTLETAIQAQLEKLELMKQFKRRYEVLNSEMQRDRESFVHNPINAYLLVKRLSLDWQRVTEIINDNPSKPLLEDLSVSEDVKLPDTEDLAGAASALVRLQETYNLSTSDLARGVLKDAQLSRPLTVNDCFELGRQLYIKSDFKHTAQWMEEAWNLLKQQQRHLHSVDFQNTELVDILEYLAFSTYKTGDVHRALELTNHLIRIDPQHPRAPGNKAVYEVEIKQISAKNRQRGDSGSDNVLNDDFSQPKQQSGLNESEDEWHRSEEFVRYMALCRGDIPVPTSVTKRLSCFYTDNKSPRLLLRPVKTEVLYDNPRLLMFHDVISDSEMDTIKQLATPRMMRATVQNSKSGELETANYRVSKTAWLRADEHPTISRVNLRVADLSGLDVETAEELQVSNYGIGGHYEPHFDFARKEEGNAFKSLGTGNRIATFIFYMSDVRLGGATVFTDLGVTVWPRRGSAAFWHNLHRSGEGDHRTRHAACPVLVGNKWVANKWMHELGQEFRRPCALSPDV